jgi:RNA polymerase sigma factor (sigma-70 family)
VGDRELIERCTRGERQAWSELFRKYDRRLLRVLSSAGRRSVGVDPADLRQDLWVKLVEKGAMGRLRLERAGSLDAFLTRVALRVALDHRRRRREVTPAAAERVDPSNPEAEVMQTEELRRLAAALGRVVRGSRRDFEILSAHLARDLGPAEIARSGIGLSAKGVASVLQRALTRLAAEMKIERLPVARARRRASGVRRQAP